MIQRSEPIEITVGRHRVSLSESECRLLKEIRSGRSRLVQHITDSQSLNSLVRKELVFTRKGRWKFDSRALARTGMAMAQQEEAHLSGFGSRAYRELEIKEQEDARQRHAEANP
jgi:hypothetical protein